MNKLRIPLVDRIHSLVASKDRASEALKASLPNSSSRLVLVIYLRSLSACFRGRAVDQEAREGMSKRRVKMWS
jgi:hypothetical protein